MTKRRRYQEDEASTLNQEPSQTVFHCEPVPSCSDSQTIVVPKNKQYNWIARDIQPAANQWQEVHGAMLNKDPIYFFNCLFDDEIIEVIMNYTNLLLLKITKRVMCHLAK